MQDNLGTGGITTNTESHERINGDEYLDPITGVLTFNNSFGSGNAVGAEDSSTPFINDVYSRNEMIDAYNIDDLGINENLYYRQAVQSAWQDLQRVDGCCHG